MEGIGCPADDLIEGAYNVDFDVDAHVEEESELFQEALRCRSLRIKPSFAIVACSPVRDSEAGLGGIGLVFG